MNNQQIYQLAVAYQRKQWRSSVIWSAAFFLGGLIVLADDAGYLNITPVKVPGKFEFGEFLLDLIPLSVTHIMITFALASAFWLGVSLYLMFSPHVTNKYIIDIHKGRIASTPNKMDKS